MGPNIYDKLTEEVNQGDRGTVNRGTRIEGRVSDRVSVDSCLLEREGNSIDTRSVSKQVRPLIKRFPGMDGEEKGRRERVGRVRRSV